MESATMENFVEILKLFHSNGYNLEDDLELLVQYVVKHGDVVIMKYLFDNGVAIVRTEALRLAIECENIEMVIYLIEIGYDLNKQNSQGNTGIHIAVANGSLEIVKCLVNVGKAKCNINAKNYAGNTAAFIAGQQAHKEILLFLIENHCNLSIENKNGFTVFHLITANGWEDILQETFNDSLVEAQFTPIHLAVLRNNFPLAQYFIDDLSLTDDTDKEEFQEIESETCCYVAKWLAKKYPNTFTICAAARHGWTSIISYLNNKNVKLDVPIDCVNLLNYNSYSPLHLACEFDHADVIEFLIDQNCNINVLDRTGKTPLYLAAECGHTGVVSLLLQHNCDVNIVDCHNNTALHAAAEFGRTDIIDLLIKIKCNVNLQNKDGKTALHLAVENGHTESVSLLLNHGYSVNLKTRSGDTPLHLATELGYKIIINLLLNSNNSCEVNLQNNFGKTPLYAAVENGCVDTVLLLLNYGCDPNIDNFDNKVVDLARRLGYTNIIDALDEYRFNQRTIKKMMLNTRKNKKYSNF